MVQLGVEGLNIRCMISNFNHRQLEPIPPSHLTFSLQLHRISHSLVDWNRFNGHLSAFLMFIVPLLQHLLYLLIPVRHITSVKCLKMSEQNWSVSKWSIPHFLISPFTPHHLTPGPGSSPPSANQQQQGYGWVARNYIYTSMNLIQYGYICCIGWVI